MHGPRVNFVWILVQHMRPNESSTSSGLDRDTKRGKVRPAARIFIHVVQVQEYGKDSHSRLTLLHLVNVVKVRVIELSLLVPEHLPKEERKGVSRQPLQCGSKPSRI